MNKFLKRYWSFLFFFVICIGFMFAEIINQRFWLSDFSVYYKAAERLIAGISLYRYPEDLHYIFKYSPTSASYFIPFLLLPLPIAKYVYWVFLSFIIVLGFYMISQLVNNFKDRQNNYNANLYILLGGVILALHFMRELHLGQVNYLLMVSFISVLFLYTKNSKPWLISLIWAAGIFIKPFGFVLLPYFIIKKRYKELFYFGLFFLVFAILPLVFYKNWGLFISQYKSWFYELNVEMAAKSDIFLPRNHTVFSVIARYFSFSLFLTSKSAVLLYKLTVLLGLCFSYLWFIKKGNNTKDSILLEFALLLATIPLLAFTTENAFCFTGLLIFVVLYYFKLISVVYRIIVIICILFIGANFSEIVGKHLSDLLDNWSIISIGTIGLITVAFHLRFKRIA